MSSSTTERRAVRCGWCINGDHHLCAVAIAMGDNRRGERVWRCPCDKGEHPGTRCTECKRYGVEVTDLSQCIDSEDCRSYRAAKRAQDPAFQAIDDITATLARGSAPRGSETPRKAAKTPSEGECICCGGTTRGGKFLPGHDARYVSTQAAAYVVAVAKDAADGATVGGGESMKIYDAMEKLGPALHAKWIKRVEKAQAANKEEATA